ncbi:MAG: hypothetical protein IK121_10630 [Lachnospiraceae bacterium]|nr:hypothetical protein [Lachnospiraceae bacterium]
MANNSLTFAPTFTRDELLKKNIVDLRHNPEHEFGYWIINNGLDVAFDMDAETHMVFEGLDENTRNMLFNSVPDKMPLPKISISNDEDVKRTVRAFEEFMKKYFSVISKYSLKHLGNDDERKLKIFEYEKGVRCLDKPDEEKADDIANFSFNLLSPNEKTLSFYRAVAETIQNQNKEVSEFLDSTNLDSPFDEVVLKHYIRDDESKNLNAEVYTYIKVLDRQKNLVSMERYEYGKDIGWNMTAYGTYVIGHTAHDGKVALRRSRKTTSIAPVYAKASNIDLYLPYDYLAFMYAWYKCLRNRRVEIREVTSRARKEASGKKSEYIKPATDRRVISLGGNMYVYTHDDNAVKGIKKRTNTWHVDSFERKGGECKYHRKDGTILLYSRRGTTVRPKKGKDNKPVTYVIK